MSTSTSTYVITNRRFPESTAVGYIATKYCGCEHLILNNNDTPSSTTFPSGSHHFVVLDDMWKPAMEHLESKGNKVSVRPDDVDHFTFLQSIFSDLKLQTANEKEVMDLFMARHKKGYVIPESWNAFFLGAQQLPMSEVFEKGVEAISAMGATLEKHTTDLVTNRVNSHSTCLKDSVAVCPATEHINLTHKTLREKHGTPITLTYFATMPPVLGLGTACTSTGGTCIECLQEPVYTVSMRGHDGALVLGHAQKYGGGGTPTGAGASKLSTRKFLQLLSDISGVARTMVYMYE